MRKILFLALGLVSLSTYAQYKGKVGINTTEPKATLDVNGNQILGTAEYTSDANVSTVVRDNKTGELKLAGKLGKSPINIITFTLSNVQGDWVSYYNTQIPVKDYTVAVIGSTFTNPANPNNVFLSAGGSTTIKRNGKEIALYNPFNVYADKHYEANGTDAEQDVWILHADYAGGGPVDNNGKEYKGTWKITCLVISNSMVNVIPSINEDFGGQNYKDAQSTPNSL